MRALCGRPELRPRLVFDALLEIHPIGGQMGGHLRLLSVSQREGVPELCNNTRLFFSSTSIAHFAMLFIRQFMNAAVIILIRILCCI